MTPRLARIAGLALGCLSLLLATGTLARAQTPATLSPDRVTLYTEPNFRGDALTVEAGATVPDLERILRPNNLPWLFAISSIKVEGSAKATIYSGTGFTGDRLEVSRSISDLYGEKRGRDGTHTWDRAVAGIAVAGPARVPISEPSNVRRYDPPPPSPRTSVVVTTPPPPPVIVHPPHVRMDRRTADMIIHRAFREVLGRNADPDGLRLYRDRLINDGWSERQIVENLQRSREARAVNADEAITKAYRDVLGRDPDPQGLAHYRSKWRDGWTQGQIRDDLRRSQERHSTHINAAITRAYRDLLGRDPDPGGYANYERGMRERGWTERDVRQNIMQSEEYRQRAGKK